MPEVRHAGTLFYFAPGDSVRMPDGHVWKVGAIARLSGESYTFLVRNSEVSMQPTEILKAMGKRLDRCACGRTLTGRSDRHRLCSTCRSRK